MDRLTHSEWRVAKNYCGDEFMYAVFRLRNTSETDHSGNREFASEYMEDRKVAAAIADKLNAEAQAALGRMEGK